MKFISLQLRLNISILLSDKKKYLLPLLNIKYCTFNYCTYFTAVLNTVYVANISSELKNSLLIPGLVLLYIKKDSQREIN